MIAMATPCICESCGHAWLAYEGDPCPVCKIADAAPGEAVVSPVGLGIWIAVLGILLAVAVAL